MSSTQPQAPPSMQSPDSSNSASAVRPPPMPVAPADPHLQKYIQAIRNAEVRRLTQAWVAGGSSEEVARRNAHVMVDGNPHHALYLYMAALRAMTADVNGRDFQNVVSLGLMEYHSYIMAESLSVAAGGGGRAEAAMQMMSLMAMTMSGTSALSAATAAGASVTASAATPTPPPPPMSSGLNFPRTSLLTRTNNNNSKQSARFGGGGASTTSLVASLANEITIPTTSIATRLLGQQWVQRAYQALLPANSSRVQSAWKNTVGDFIRMVVAGVSRHPEEGSAMRWLALPTPQPDFVQKVMANVEQYREELPGYYAKPPEQSAETFHSTEKDSGQPGEAVTAGKRKRHNLWVPPSTRNGASEAAGQDETLSELMVPSNSLSPLSSSGDDKRASAKKRRTAKRQREETSSPSSSSSSSPSTSSKQNKAFSFIPLPDSLPVAFHIPNTMMENRKMNKAEIARRKARAQRFNLDNSPLQNSKSSSTHKSLVPAKVIGRSTALEKQYLRLCGPPDPALVRTEASLHRSFFHVLEKFFDRPSYQYVDEQLRSIRQDFVVQGITSPFLYFVYSINSRISQIFQDLGQFNQCQGQLTNLERSLPHSFSTEMIVHRLLYAAVNNLDAEFAKTYRQATLINPSVKSDRSLCWVLRLRQALQEQNYCRALRLIGGYTANCREVDHSYLINCDDPTVPLDIVHDIIKSFKSFWENNHNCSPEDCMNQIRCIEQQVWTTAKKLPRTPFLCQSIITVVKPKIQMLYLLLLSKAHYTLNVTQVSKWLSFPSPAACRTFLVNQQASFSNDGESLDCRKSQPIFQLSPLLSKKVKAMG